jgi:hypothetical protein
MMKKKLKILIGQRIRKSRILNLFPRILCATSYYNAKYLKILKWGFISREDTNYTYDLSDLNIAYLASTISVVTKQPFNTIYSYIEEARNDTELKNYVIRKTTNSEFRNVADFRCEFGRRLGWYGFTRAIKPKIVIETGLDKGIGSVLLCAALLRNNKEGFEGQYYGTDINPNAGFLLDEQYKKVGKILYGDSIESLKRLDFKIDLFINDSDHSPDYEYREYLAIKDKLSSNAIILGDNSHSTDKLYLFSIETSRHFLFFPEVPRDHWYPGAGIGISF